MQDQRLIPAEQIQTHPCNFRLAREEAVYQALVASMKTRGFDVAHPLRVRPISTDAGDTEQFQLIGGENRFRAGCEAGLAAFPCVVETLSDSEALVELAADNEQAPFTPIEKALILREIERTGGVVASALPRLGLNASEASRLKKALLVFEFAVKQGCAGAKLRTKHSLLAEVAQLPRDAWPSLVLRVERGTVKRDELRALVSQQRLESSAAANSEASRPADARGDTPPTRQTAANTERMKGSSSTPGRRASTKPAQKDAPADVWLSSDDLQVVYAFPQAPPGWGCALVDGTPVFGPLKSAGTACQPLAGSSPAEHSLPPWPLLAPALSNLNLRAVDLTDELLEALHDIAPALEPGEAKAFVCPDGVTDSLGLVLGASAAELREVLVLPHARQHQRLELFQLSLRGAHELHLDEADARTQDRPLALAYGATSSASSRQHLKLMAVLSAQGPDEPERARVVTVVANHIVEMPEDRLHAAGGGSLCRLFALAPRDSSEGEHS